MRAGIWAIGLALVATPALGAPDPKGAPAAPADPQAGAVDAAILLMAQGRSAEASVAIDPVLAAYKASYASEKRTIYCGMSGVETILYMGMAASAKTSAVAIYPGWCSALFLKGFVLVDQKQVAAALPYLQRAVTMAPYHAHFLNELGYAFQALKQWPESLAAYDRAATASGMAMDGQQKLERGRAWRGMGYVLVEQGKWDDAEDMYRKCLKLDRNDNKAKSELQFIKENRPKIS